MFDKKGLRLMLGMARNNPSGFLERAVATVDRYRDRFRRGNSSYSPVNLAQALAWLDNKLPVPISQFMAEAELQEIEWQVSQKTLELRSCSPFPSYENADYTLARFCYAACRALKPQAVLETGVASGVTSAFILQALAINGGGAHLWSIDLPPLSDGAERYVGAAVPESFKSHWRLKIGSSRRLLPDLLSELAKIDLFIHDSLHTYRNMLWEFQAVWPFLAPGGLLVADDVNFNQAFADFVKAKARMPWSVVQEENKDSNFAAALKEA